MIQFKKNETYQEIELFDGDTKIGEAEVDVKGKMLSRMTIFEPYQNKGLGTEIVKTLTEEYGLNVLWVNADNKRAIHVYEKCGYVIDEAGMYIMRRPADNDKKENNETRMDGSNDAVNHPNHYAGANGVECIRAIEASMSPDGFQDYCKGNVEKYIWRWREKAGVEDLKKARVYLNWLIESAEKDGET